MTQTSLVEVLKSKNLKHISLPTISHPHILHPLIALCSHLVLQLVHNRQETAQVYVLVSVGTESVLPLI